MNIKKPPDIIYKSYKTSFKSIIKDEYMKSRIEDLVYRTNDIISRSYLFIKYYILYNFENGIDLPKIDEDFIKKVFNLVSKGSNKGRKSNKEYDLNLSDFYKNHFEILLQDKELYNKSNMNQVLNYSTTSMITCFENSISTNYFNFLFRYINSIFKTPHKEHIETLKDEERIEYVKKLNGEIKEIKNDLLNNTLQSKSIYHTWIKEAYGRIIPKFENINKSYFYDIKEDPFKYLVCLLNMNIELEDLGRKTFNALPIRSSFIPKYIDIDTKSLIELSNLKDKNKYLKDIENHKHQIWKEFFNINKKVFQENKDYRFNYKIQTDGVGVSITFIDKRFFNKNPPKQKKKKDVNEFDYFEDLTQEQMNDLKEDYNFVYIDPGKNTLLYMMDDHKSFMKYTNKQRCFETERLKYQEINEKLKLKHDIKRYEAELSLCNSKSCKLATFKEYIIARERLSVIFKEFYKIEKYRKFELRKYINKQRSENKLINNIRNKYTIKDENKIKNPLLIIGNWNITKSQRNFMSTPCIGLKRLLAKNFKLYTMDEFRTSCLSYRNEELVKNKYDDNSNKKIHSVLIHMEKNKGIGCINRDKNAVQNYQKIIKSYLVSYKRPLKYCRNYDLKLNVGADENHATIPDSSLQQSMSHMPIATLIVI